jgi:hypothetical protein
LAGQDRTPLDLLLGHVDGDVPLASVDFDQRSPSDRYVDAGEPVSGVGDQVANHPALVVEVEVPYRPDLTVKAGQPVAGNHAGFPQHRRAPFRRAD